jgi:hypothetical protein
MVLSLGAAPAKSMPFGPGLFGASSVDPVACGCDPGWTRGPYGNCHPMGYVGPRPVYGYGYFPPYAYHPYAYRPCWWRADVRVCG